MVYPINSLRNERGRGHNTRSLHNNLSTYGFTERGLSRDVRSASVCLGFSREPRLPRSKRCTHFPGNNTSAGRMKTRFDKSAFVLRSAVVLYVRTRAPEHVGLYTSPM